MEWAIRTGVRLEEVFEHIAQAPGALKFVVISS